MSDRPPVFSVAVRTTNGTTGLFRISHEEVRDHEQVMSLVRGVLPEAKVILVGIG